MTDNARHFTGVGLFCAGSLTYSIAFLRVARRDERADTTEHAWVRDVLEWCLLGATVALVIAFVALWAQEETMGMHGTDHVQNAYIVEHAAYLSHILFYAVFFYYHTPDLDKPAKNDKLAREYERDEDRGADGVPMVCRPLLIRCQNERLPVIFETIPVQTV
jgi:hypothetical protein